MGKKKWYVVFEGKTPGVYEDWEDVQELVNMVPGNCHKSFKTKAEAEYRYKRYMCRADERKRGGADEKKMEDEKMEDERKRCHGMKTYIGISIFIVVIAIMLYVVVV